MCVITLSMESETQQVKDSKQEVETTESNEIISESDIEIPQNEEADVITQENVEDISEDEALEDLLNTYVREPSKVPTASEVGRPKTPPRPPTPVLVQLPEPTRLQVATERAKAIAKEAAKANWKRMQNDNYTAFQAKKQYKKMVENDPVVVEEKVIKCNRLNRYRKYYKGRINHQFKSHYDPDKMTLAQIDAELASITDELNGRNVPFFVKEFVSHMCEAT
jgi:hypothetical protein